MKLSKLILVLFFCFSFLGLFPSDLLLGKKVVEITVDKRKVQTGEVFTYKVKIEGIFSKPTLSLPEFKNFKIISQKQSKSYTFVKGKVKTKINLTYRLFAQKAGVFTIRPVILNDRKKRYKSLSVKIRVEGKSLTKKKSLRLYIAEGTDL